MELTIDVQGVPCRFRLLTNTDSYAVVADVIDSAVKACGKLWVPAPEHEVDPGGVADKATFEGEVYLDAGRLVSSLIRAGYDAGMALDLVGAGDEGASAGNPAMVLSQEQLGPRRVQLQLLEDGVEVFKGRHDDFLGWAAG